MILADPRNPTAVRYRAELAARLDPDDTEGVTVVIGGDGYLLHSVAEHGFDRTYLGINAGRIGFLMNDVADWDAVADKLRQRAWTVHTFPVLSAELTHADGTTREVHAVNDVAIERSTGQTAHLALSIDDADVVDPLVCDGLIVATALGSTAYTFSAGGPACHPSLPLLVVTAVAPHHPRLAPFLLPPGARARVRVNTPERRPVRAVADGVAIDGIVALDVGIGDRSVRLAWLDGHDFTKRMITKILRA